MNAADNHWMSRALELAEHGRGLVEPNPLVGAVLVRDGQVLGEGWHQRYGEAHAEVYALAAAHARGADLYVTLEPCCHHGKTPPCTDAILRAGVTRVVVAMVDPFPEVAGKGLELLRAAGLTCEVGAGAGEAHRLNAPYLTLLKRGRPYVHAKWAMTLDGKIATASGDSKWISNEASRRRVHDLRGRVDAIIIGIATALTDDPSLTARPPGPRLAIRIILDSQARLPPTAELVRTAGQVPTMVVTAPNLPPERTAPLRQAGCEVFPVAGGGRRPNVTMLLQELGRRRLTNVLIEGGSGVLGSFLDAGAIDEFHVFIAPILAGGALARTAVGGQGTETIREALRLNRCLVETIGADVYLRGWREDAAEWAADPPRSS